MMKSVPIHIDRALFLLKNEREQRRLAILAEGKSAPVPNSENEPKRAKIMSADQLERALEFVALGESAESDQVKLLLSHYAGLRAAEIASLTPSAVTNAQGEIGDQIWIPRVRSKSKRERTIPMHPRLRQALIAYRKRYPNLQYFACSEMGSLHRRQSPNAMAVWFSRLYKTLGYHGCTSHSGRRGFITHAARTAGQYGQSIHDVQRLAGHARLDTTAAYIDASDDLTALVHSLGKRPNAGAARRAPRF